MQTNPDNKSEGDIEKIVGLYSHSNELRDTFYSNSKKKKNVFHVLLNASGLVLQKDTLTVTGSSTKDHLIKISDIIGGRCVRLQNPGRFKSASSGCGVCTPKVSDKKGTENYEDAYLYVFAYILKKNRRNVVRRERTVITLRFRSFDSHDDNMREAEKWYIALKAHRDNYLNQYLPGTVSGRVAMKRLLILLNPKSGSGKARDMFHHQVVPVLNEAEIPYDLYVTKHSHYAFDFIRKRDLSVWSGIVAIGGDGLFHEILNGLLKRLDWESVINISLGIVPCGSGNGLARSIAHLFEEPYEPKPILGAALTLVSGHTAKMDVVEIEIDKKVMYSFLSIGWGLISDIDIESERLRPLGYQRFTIWTLHRLINLRTYRGRVSYIPMNESSVNTEARQMTGCKSGLQHSISCNVFLPPTISKGCKSSDHISDTEFEDVISLETLANQSFRSRCGSWQSGSRKSTYYSIAESVYHSISDSSEYNNSISPDEVDENSDMEYVCLSKKRTMPLEISDRWVVEEGDFVMMHAAYQSHLGSDCHFSPQSKLNDGTIHLVIIRGGISRSQLLTFLINMSSGTHLPSENTAFIKVVRVEAFRLDPQENTGILTVDGERVKCCPLQARIIPGAINIMIPNHKD